MSICENAGFRTMCCVNFNVLASFRRSFYLEQRLIKGMLPNPFYPFRAVLLRLANSLERLVPSIGYDTLYVGKRL